MSVAIARELRRLVPRDELDGDDLLARGDPRGLAGADPGVRRARRRACAPTARRGRRSHGVAPGTAAIDIGPRLADAVRGVAATGQAARPRADPRASRTGARFEAHLRAHPNGSGRNVVAVLVDVTGSVRLPRGAAPVLGRRLARAAHAAGAHPRAWPRRWRCRSRTPSARRWSRRPRSRSTTCAGLVDEMLLLASLDRGKAALAEGVSNAGAASREDVVADRRSRRAQRGRELRRAGVPRRPVRAGGPAAARGGDRQPRRQRAAARRRRTPRSTVDRAGGRRDEVEIIVRRQRRRHPAGAPAARVRALLPRRGVAVRAPARASAWRSSSTSWRRTTARSRSSRARGAGRWCASCCRRRRPRPRTRRRGRRQPSASAGSGSKR